MHMYVIYVRKWLSVIAKEKGEQEKETEEC